MNTSNDPGDVSIRFSLTLESGESVISSLSEDRFDYTPGHDEIMPALEEALAGAQKGEKRQFVLSPEVDPDLKLDVSRLALLLGHPGETLILKVEIL